MKSPSSSLSCPRCSLTYALDERFCAKCGMPLVYSGHERINAEYTRGDLVRIAGGRNQAEAELIQNLLMEEGIPSVVRRSAGFDVPDYLAGGPRDILVAQSAAEAAHEMLLETDLAPKTAPEVARSPLQTTLIVLGLVAVAVLFVYVMWLLAPGG